MKIDYFLERAYRLRLIKRFSIREVVNETSPAEHSWFVSMLAFYIGIEYNNSITSGVEGTPYNMMALISKAMLHDVPEVITSDIVHFIKHYDNETGQKFKEIEYEAVEKSLLGATEGNLRSYLQHLILNAKDSTPEGRLVGLCDLLEILFYMVEERSLGNKNQWVDEVYQGAFDLIEKLLVDADKHLESIVGKIMFRLSDRMGEINLPENSDLIGQSYDKAAIRKVETDDKKDE